MGSQQFAEIFTGVTGIVLIIISAIWSILMFFMPFMVYSIMQSNKELLRLNQKILTELQGKGSDKESKRIEPKL